MCGLAGIRDPTPLMYSTNKVLVQEIKVPTHKKHGFHKSRAGCKPRQIPQFDFLLTPLRSRRGRSRLNAASGIGQYGTILRCRKRTCEVERSLRCRKPTPGSSRREPAALSGRLVLWGYLGNALGSQGRLGIGLGPLEVLRVSKDTFVAAKCVLRVKKRACVLRV